MDMDEMMERAYGMLVALESKRDIAVSMSRNIIRETKRTIHSIHAGEDHTKKLDALRSDVSSMMAELSGTPEISYSGVVQDALAEYAEAAILSAISRDVMMPSHADLGITPQSWVMGLADTIGEMRRMVLDALVADDVDRARHIFETMDKVYEGIMMIDIADAIVPIRRKQDIARSVIERTRTDLSNALIMKRV